MSELPDASALMQEFYLSSAYNPNAGRPADNVQAAISFTLARIAAAVQEGDGSDPILLRQEFCERFKARMIEVAGEKFEDGSSIAEYADETAPAYWDERERSFLKDPADCADADMSYWGED